MVCNLLAYVYLKPYFGPKTALFGKKSLWQVISSGFEEIIAIYAICGYFWLGVFNGRNVSPTLDCALPGIKNVGGISV